MFGNGMGGLSAGGIKLALDMTPWIQENEKPLLTRKIIAYMITAINAQHEDQPMPKSGGGSEMSASQADRVIAKTKAKAKKGKTHGTKNKTRPRSTRRR